MGCNCKKNGKGHNFIPDRITVLGEGGNEITNRDLVCHHCVYKKRGDTSSCLKYEKKPESVFNGKGCESFLSSGHDLGGNKHSCADCGDCAGDCKNSCGSCGGECTDCGGCGK